MSIKFRKGSVDVKEYMFDASPFSLWCDILQADLMLINVIQLKQLEIKATFLHALLQGRSGKQHKINMWHFQWLVSLCSVLHSWKVLPTRCSAICSYIVVCLFYVYTAYSATFSVNILGSSEYTFPEAYKVILFRSALMRTGLLKDLVDAWHWRHLLDGQPSPFTPHVASTFASWSICVILMLLLSGIVRL